MSTNIRFTIRQQISIVVAPAIIFYLYSSINCRRVFCQLITADSIHSYSTGSRCLKNLAFDQLFFFYCSFMILLWTCCIKRTVIINIRTFYNDRILLIAWKIGITIINIIIKLHSCRMFFSTHFPFFQLTDLPMWCRVSTFIVKNIIFHSKLPRTLSANDIRIGSSACIKGIVINLPYVCFSDIRCPFRI